MNTDSNIYSAATARAQSTVIKDLKVLKCPEEGGTKKDYDDFLETLENHVRIAWVHEKDIRYVAKHGALPEIEEPTDPTGPTTKWGQRLWDQMVDNYGHRMMCLDENLSAMYALVMDHVSKMIKAKVRSRKGHISAAEDNDIVWLLSALEDIMIKFEEDKPVTLAIDDQMEHIMKLKQGDATHEDFIKLYMKELKIYEKHGGDFLWGKIQQESLIELVKEQKT